MDMYDFTYELGYATIPFILIIITISLVSFIYWKVKQHSPKKGIYTVFSAIGGYYLLRLIAWTFGIRGVYSFLVLAIHAIIYISLALIVKTFPNKISKILSSLILAFGFIIFVFSAFQSLYEEEQFNNAIEADTNNNDSNTETTEQDIVIPFELDSDVFNSENGKVLISGKTIPNAKITLINDEIVADEDGLFSHYTELPSFKNQSLINGDIIESYTKAYSNDYSTNSIDVKIRLTGEDLENWKNQKEALTFSESKTEELSEGESDNEVSNTSLDTETFKESIERLKEETEHVLLSVEPLDGDYTTLIVTVVNETAYETEEKRLLVADYLGREIQKRALGSLFGGNIEETPFVEIRYQDGSAMARSQIFDITSFTLID